MLKVNIPKTPENQNILVWTEYFCKLYRRDGMDRGHYKTGGEGQEIQTRLSCIILTASAEQSELGDECGNKPRFKSAT